MKVDWFKLNWSIPFLGVSMAHRSLDGLDVRENPTKLRMISIFHGNIYDFRLGFSNQSIDSQILQVALFLRSSKRD